MWDHPFVYCVDAAFVRNCPVPTFLLPGTDIPHPAVTSAELVTLLPGVEVVTDWRGPQYLDQQRKRVVAFLKRYTPAAESSAPNGCHRRGLKRNGSMLTVSACVASGWRGFNSRFQACGTRTDGTRTVADDTEASQALPP
jgi:hypothetical protein